MTRAIPMRPCKTYGCKNVVERGYCDTCARARALVERHAPSATPRETRTQRGYTNDWSRASRAFLAERPLCAKCSTDDRPVAASQVDHIVPWRTGKTKAERDQLFWDESNWQALCASCHSIKTRREMAENERGRGGGAALPRDVPLPAIPVHVVCGPSTSVCMEWVARRAHESHVTIEVEHLVSVLHHARLFELDERDAWRRAMCERNRLLKSLARETQWSAAWFITPGERICDRRFWRERLNARVTVVAPPVDVCLEHDARDEYGGKERRAENVRRWWRTYALDPSDVVVSCITDSTARRTVLHDGASNA